MNPSANMLFLTGLNRLRGFTTFLFLQYDYVGAYQQGNNFLEQKLEQFNKKLLLGLIILLPSSSCLSSLSNEKIL